MVLYFSGSGNSKYVAKVMAKGMCDELVSINDLLKQNSNTCWLRILRDNFVQYAGKLHYDVPNCF